MIKAAGVDIKQLREDLRMVEKKKIMRFESLDKFVRLGPSSEEESSEEEKSSSEGSDEDEEDRSERDDNDEAVKPGDSSSQVGEYGCRKRKRKHGK